MNLKLTYDRSIDAAYIYLVDNIQQGEVAFTYPCDPAEMRGEINLDFDSDGHLLGIEVQNASKVVSNALLAEAEIIG